ncbi:MAG: hypothetical protein GY906_05790 [bacterium]|nr:hypothetical protein [bacterium]
MPFRYHAGVRLESELIPYAVGELRGSPLVVLAPHPDDEVFGCAAALAQAARFGSEAHVVILTDGAAQGDGTSRQAESQEAARRLGVSEPRFLGFDDRSLDPGEPELLERLRGLLVELRPKVLLVPSTAELHPDHRAVALAVYRILRDASSDAELIAAVENTQLVAYEVSSFLRPNLLLDLTADWEAAVAAAEAFGSQNEILPYLEVFSAVTAARRLTLPETVQRAQAFFDVDREFIDSHTLLEWAACQGPTDALETDESYVSLRSEVRRLKTLLETIHGSKTWRVHQMVEKIRSIFGLRRVNQ